MFKHILVAVLGLAFLSMAAEPPKLAGPAVTAVPTPLVLKVFHNVGIYKAKDMTKYGCTVDRTISGLWDADTPTGPIKVNVVCLQIAGFNFLAYVHDPAVSALIFKEGAKVKLSLWDPANPENPVNDGNAKIEVSFGETVVHSGFYLSNDVAKGVNIIQAPLPEKSEKK